MFHRTVPFLLLLTGLSVVSGYLLSKASLVGRAGIHFFYKEYRFLKTWYKGAAAVLAVWLLLFGVHWLVQTKVGGNKAKWIHISAIAVAAIGLYGTYADFRADLSYRLLGERFHIGAYLFWIGWMLIAFFHLWPRPAASVSTPADKLP